MMIWCCTKQACVVQLRQQTITSARMRTAHLVRTDPARMVLTPGPRTRNSSPRTLITRASPPTITGSRVSHFQAYEIRNCAACGGSAPSAGLHCVHKSCHVQNVCLIRTLYQRSRLKQGVLRLTFCRPSSWRRLSCGRWEPGRGRWLLSGPTQPASSCQCPSHTACLCRAQATHLPQL